MCVYNALDETYYGSSYKEGAKKVVELMRDNVCLKQTTLDADKVESALLSCLEIRMQIGAHLDDKHYWQADSEAKYHFTYREYVNPENSGLKALLLEALGYVALASLAIHFVARHCEWIDVKKTDDGRPVYAASLDFRLPKCSCSTTHNGSTKCEYASPIKKIREIIANVSWLAQNVPSPTKSSVNAKMVTSLHLLSVTKKLLQEPLLKNCQGMNENPSCDPDNEQTAHEIAALVTYHQAKNLARTWCKQNDKPIFTVVDEDEEIERNLWTNRNNYVHFEFIKEEICAERKDSSHCVLHYKKSVNRVPPDTLRKIRDRLIPQRQAYYESLIMESTRREVEKLGD